MKRSNAKPTDITIEFPINWGRLISEAFCLNVQMELITFVCAIFGPYYHFSHVCK